MNASMRLPHLVYMVYTPSIYTGNTYSGEPKGKHRHSDKKDIWGEAKRTLRGVQLLPSSLKHCSMYFNHLEYQYSRESILQTGSTLTNQSVLYGLALWTSAGSMLEMQNLEPHLHLLNQNQHFNKIPR